MRTVRGHEWIAIATCSVPARARGVAAFVVVRDSYRVDVLWIDRDRLADAETCLPAGVRRALSQK